jgi:hypothetical protein
MGEKVEEIAQSEGVSIKAIEKSIRQVSMERAIHTQQNLSTAVISMLMGNMRGVDQAFKKGLKAQNFLERKNADGSNQFVPVDDTETQLKTLQVYGKFLEAMQPKGSGISVSVQQNNANQANQTNMRNGGYESMLRSVLDKVHAHNELPRETADVIEAEKEDDSSDEDEGMVQA